MYIAGMHGKIKLVTNPRPTTHQVSHFRTNGGGGIEDDIDDLSKEPVLVVRCGCYLTNGSEENKVWEKSKI